jgi:hypothetical protein
MKLMSGFMLLVFLAGVMPKEYLHDLFFNHHDDVHPVYKVGEIVVTPKHKHCSFVGFVLAPFVKSEQQFLILSPVYPVYARYQLSRYRREYATPILSQSLRGPPAC